MPTKASDSPRVAPSSGVNSALQVLSCSVHDHSGRNQPEPTYTNAKAKASRPARKNNIPTRRAAARARPGPRAGLGARVDVQDLDPFVAGAQGVHLVAAHRREPLPAVLLVR